MLSGAISAGLIAKMTAEVRVGAGTSAWWGGVGPGTRSLLLCPRLTGSTLWLRGDELGAFSARPSQTPHPSRLLDHQDSGHS